MKQLVVAPGSYRQLAPKTDPRMSRSANVSLRDLIVLLPTPI
jgi:hypothetical protein